MSEQNIRNQRGEIEFRRKLLRQQVTGERLLEDEFDTEGIEQVLRERMDATRSRMESLRERGIPLSPYVEIGAERGQRSLVMENDLGAAGAAVDLSFDMLRSCGHYGEVFGKNRAPLRVCCDAYALPFQSGSVPFAFCYQTLHHFPDPTPIVQEIHRVLAPGGWFHFDEEPFKRVLRLVLYTRDRAYSEKSQARGNARRLIDAIFSEIRCNETDYGIVENDDITLKTWRGALACFKEKHVDLEIPRVPSSRVSLYGRRSPLKFAAAYLLGGNISGICRKAGGDPDAGGSIEDRLRCPVCAEGGREVPVAAGASGFTCSGCAKSYPVIDGVLFLFTDAKFESLYPDQSLASRPPSAG